MALIHCPECNKEISDKVAACPHCGYPFTENSLPKNESQPQQVEVTGVRLNKGGYKKVSLIIISIVIILAAVFFGFRYINQQKAQRIFEASFNAYIENLYTAQALMLAGGSEAESLCNLTANVWQNAIYEESDITTDKYTKPNGFFVDDFNIALTNLYKDSSTKAKITGIESNQSDVQTVIRDLQNPPVGLENCYETITELYTAYKGLTNLAINPTGSYNTFTSSKNEKIENFMEAFDKLGSQIPEPIKSN